VFFNLFPAAEPSANVCLAHGTLCNHPSVYIAITAQNCGCEFRPRQFWSVSAKPLAVTRGNPVEKHCSELIKFLYDFFQDLFKNFWIGFCYAYMHTYPWALEGIFSKGGNGGFFQG